MNLSVGQILSDTFGVVRAKFWGLVGLWLAFFAIMMAAVVVFMMAIGGSALALAGGLQNPETMGAGLGAGMFLLIIAFYVIYLLIASAQYGALNAMASPLRQADFGQAFATGWRSSPTLLLVMILLLIAYVIGALVLGALLGLLSGLGSAVSVVGAVLVFGLVLYLACRLSVVFPIVPVEGVRNPITAIGRAWSMTRGNALPIFLAMLLFLVIAGALFAALFIPYFGVLSASDGEAAPAIGGMIFFFVGIILLSVVFAVSYSALLSCIHARLAGGGEQLTETFD